jgi:hypothetical protein
MNRERSQMSEARERISAVRRILLGDWDPIGVQNLPDKYRQATTDEYDSYIGPVIGMLVAGKSKTEIADFLHDTEIRNIGIRRDRGAADATAEKLVDLRVLLTAGK